MIEIFTWTAMVTIVAGTMPNWQAFEPLTLPRWDLLDWKAQDDALRLLEEHDIDFTIIAWPCTPWSIMQNLNQQPHQIRALPGAPKYAPGAYLAVFWQGSCSS